MSLNKSSNGINSAAVQRLTTSLVKNKNSVLSDAALLHRLTDLKNTITALEGDYLARASQTASETLRRMSEEERRMLLMWPEEKAFFLRYKKSIPKIRRTIIPSIKNDANDLRKKRRASAVVSTAVR